MNSPQILSKRVFLRSALVYQTPECCFLCSSSSHCSIEHISTCISTYIKCAYARMHAREANSNTASEANNAHTHLPPSAPLWPLLSRTPTDQPQSYSAQRIAPSIAKPYSLPCCAAVVYRSSGRLELPPSKKRVPCAYALLPRSHSRMCVVCVYVFTLRRSFVCASHECFVVSAVFRSQVVHGFGNHFACASSECVCFVFLCVEGVFWVWARWSLFAYGVFFFSVLCVCVDWIRV